MEQQTQDTNTEQNTLTLNDVILMHNVIATVSRRGGFEAAEFEIVGALFNKLKALLPEQPEATEEANAETANTSTEGDQMKFEFVEEGAAETVTQ